MSDVETFVDSLELPDALYSVGRVTGTKWRDNVRCERNFAVQAIRAYLARPPVTDEQAVAELMRLADVSSYAQAELSVPGTLKTSDEFNRAYAARTALEAALRAAIAHPPVTAEPIDMILFCPACGTQHVDAPDERTPDWKNEPHRSHLCHNCGNIWRPADVATNGVAAIKTKGKADSPQATLAHPHAALAAKERSNDLRR